MPHTRPHREQALAEAKAAHANLNKEHEDLLICLAEQVWWLAPAWSPSPLLARSFIVRSGGVCNSWHTYIHACKHALLCCGYLYPDVSPLVFRPASPIVGT